MEIAYMLVVRANATRRALETFDACFTHALLMNYFGIFKSSVMPAMVKGLHVLSTAGWFRS